MDNLERDRRRQRVEAVTASSGPVPQPVLRDPSHGCASSPVDTHSDALPQGGIHGLGAWVLIPSLLST